MDYDELSIEELEEIALSGDETAADVYMRRTNTYEDNLEQESSLDREVPDYIIPDQLLSANETYETCNVHDVEEKDAINHYLTELQKEPLYLLKDKADAGDLYALFVYGLLQSKSSYEIETIRGLNDMKRCIEGIKTDLQDGKLNTSTFVEMVTQYAEACMNCYFKYYASSDSDYYGDESFSAASLAYEVNPSNPDLLITCYTEGIGCEKDSEKVLELKGRKARKNGCVECAEFAVELLNNGMIVKAAEWIQKALAADDACNHPKLTSALRIRLSKSGYSDEKGNEIDLDAEYEAYNDCNAKPEYDEAICLFHLTDSEEEKMKLSEYCGDNREVRASVENFEARKREKELEEKQRKQRERELAEAEERRKAAEELAEKKHREDINRIKKITNDPANHYESLKKLSLLVLKENADSGDTYAQFLYGKTQFELATEEKEKMNGLSTMERAIADLSEALQESDQALFLSEIIAIYADKCIEECAILQKLGEREKLDEYMKIAFCMYSNAYELDSNKIDRLIWCYERGIGCEKNEDRALELKITKAERGGAIEHADVVIEYVKRGMTVQSALWAQKLLTCDDIEDFPKLAARMRMFLSEKGYTDETGRDIDLREIEEIYYSDKDIPTPKEAYRLFILANDPDDKLKYARLSNKNKTTDAYIQQRESELESLRQKEIAAERRAARAKEREIEIQKYKKGVEEKLEGIKATGKAVSENNNTNRLLIAAIAVLAIVCLVIVGKLLLSAQGGMAKVFAVAIVLLVAFVLILKKRKG